MSTSVTRHENWSEHQTTMFSSLHEKQKAGKFCDVILKCHDSDQTFNAHSCVLSSASPVLEKLLQDAIDSNSMGAMGKIQVVLPSDISSSCIESLINFIYSGNIDLSQTKTTTSEETSRRKSKRSSTSSSKSKSSDGIAADDSASINISSLYSFLKASRCLEINTLTEHLESAVTLSEMKMSELASASRPQRASVSKNQIVPKSCSADSSPSVVGTPKNGKSKKRKQQIDKKIIETRATKAKLPKKKTNKEGKPSTTTKMTTHDSSSASDDSPDHERDDSSTELILVKLELADADGELSTTKGQQASTGTLRKDVSTGPISEDLSCGLCKASFKTRSSMKRHTCQQQTDEQVRSVDSFPVTNRSSKKLQCPTCQKIFTSASVYELHMKKHISEIEAALAERAKLRDLERERSIPTAPPVDKTNEETPISEKNSEPEVSTPLAEKQGPRLASEGRPKRASTKKFQDMMKAAFGTESSNSGSEIDTPKRKKKSSVTNSDISKGTKQTTANVLSKDPGEEVVGKAKGDMPDPSHVTDPETNLQSIPYTEPNEIPLTSIVEEGQEYVPLEKMDVAEMITVDSKVSSPDFDDTSSLDLVEQLTEDNISEEHSVVVPEGVLMPVADSPVDESQDALLELTEGQATQVKGKTQLHMCDVCGVLVADKKAHMKEHAGQKLKCEVCSQGFRFKSALIRHMKYHSGEGQECSICKERFFSQKDMQRHLTTHNVKKMRTECPICKKSFTNQYVMKLHQRSHSGDEKYSCEVCHRKFPYKTSLKTHMLLHSGERPYICSVCGKCFVQKIHAREHELQHAGVRRFECPICHRCFAHKCGMTRHITDIHHKMRPYKCETCGKSFPRKTKLIEHNRMHTGEKPYVCDICGVSYKANRSLKYHKKMQHDIIVKDYEVAIWRNGPLPDPPKAFQQPRRRKKQATVTFNFPVSTESINVSMNKEEEEKIINNIATEVDVISTETAHPSPPGSPDSAASKEESPVHYHYQLQETEPSYEPTQYATLPEATAYQTTTTLPPASTLTKADPSSVAMSGFPAPDQKTFIVSLSTTVDAGLPMVAAQSQIISPNPLPGVMLTYMMPPQAVERTDLTPVNIAEASNEQASLQLSRSASVPPMSTFRRQSNPTIPHVTNNTTVTPLPGMHTFTPVQLPASQLSHPLIAGFPPVPGVPVLVPATPVMSVAQTTQPAPMQVTGQTEWQTAEYQVAGS